MRRWLAGACVVAALAGCKTLANALQFAEPEVQLKEVQITGLGLTGGTLNLALDVYNPNDYRLRSTRLELGIDLENTHFGDAVLETPLELPSQQHTLVTLPVRFEWAGVGAGARALLSRQAIAFGLTGTAYLGTPLGDRRVQVHGSGNVPLRRLIQ
ncbi:MAG TPA: LEA type 2 family protein [Gemmatimonadales bacterium]|nr:LEA type 2 family protein [Gemmatimonadales bacterium]